MFYTDLIGKFMFKAGWLCYHIDDLLNPKHRLPTVRALQKLTISKLFDRAVHGERTVITSRQGAMEVQDTENIMETEESVETITNTEEDPMETEESNMDTKDMMNENMNAQGIVNADALEQVELDVDELVRECLYSATKMLTDGNGRADRKVERVHQLQKELAIRYHPGK